MNEETTTAINEETASGTIEFSGEGLQELEEILQCYPNKKAAMLPVLHLARHEFKTITPEVMQYVAGLLDLEPIRVFDVVSFYTLFPSEIEGQYVIQVCATLSCDVMGARSVVDHIEKKLGIEVGQTTEDGKFTLKKVECLGSCGTAPMMQINDDYYENSTEERIDEILDGME